MRHKISGRKLSRNTGHRMLMLRTMATDLIRHEALRTTDAKAREVSEREQGGQELMRRPGMTYARYKELA